MTPYISPNPEIEKAFWFFVYERQNIWYKRFVLDTSPPYTEDIYMNKYDFSNVYRVLDLKTQYAVSIMEDENSPIAEIIASIFMFRHVYDSSIDEYMKPKTDASHQLFIQWVHKAHSIDIKQAETMLQLASMLLKAFNICPIPILYDFTIPLKRLGGAPLALMTSCNDNVLPSKSAINALCDMDIKGTQLIIKRAMYDMQERQHMAFYDLGLKFEYIQIGNNRQIPLSVVDIDQCLSEFYKWWSLLMGRRINVSSFDPYKPTIQSLYLTIPAWGDKNNWK